MHENYFFNKKVIAGYSRDTGGCTIPTTIFIVSLPKVVTFVEIKVFLRGVEFRSWPRHGDRRRPKRRPPATEMATAATETARRVAPSQDDVSFQNTLSQKACLQSSLPDCSLADCSLPACLQSSLPNCSLHDCSLRDCSLRACVHRLQYIDCST